jgi:hypothetical protein
LIFLRSNYNQTNKASQTRGKEKEENIMNNAKIIIEAMNKAMEKGINPIETNGFDHWNDYDLFEGQELAVTAKKNGEYKYLDEMGELGDDPSSANRNIHEQIEIAKAYGFEFCRLEVINPVYLVVAQETFDRVDDANSIEEARDLVQSYVNDDLENDVLEGKEVKEREEYEKFYQIVYQLSSTGKIKAFRD